MARIVASTYVHSAPKKRPGIHSKSKTSSSKNKDDKMEFTSIQFFNMMTDEDFIAVHKAGQLTNLCLALTLDLQIHNHGKDKTYTA